MSFKVNCQDCKKEIITTRSKQKRCASCYQKSRINIACCKDCGKKLRHPQSLRCVKCFGKYNSGSNSKTWKGGLPNCLVCNEKLSVYKNSAQYDTGICQECYKGKLTKRWNPELESEIRIKGRSVNPKYRIWRKEVFSIHGYSCVVCNSSNKLVAHHLNSFTTNKELRTDVNNGVVCCIVCHKDFHSKYGYLNNTEEQFKDYLINNIKI